jgi:8-oxo-dGTP pyrophosphatase MutT (NUDIX family)
MGDATLETIQRILSATPARTLDDPALTASAVVLLLYPKDGQENLLLNKRTQEVAFNKGEICFPGGAQDRGDANLKATALRECQEEMGIRPEDVTLVGELDNTSTRAGFAIHPFVGTIPYPYTFRPNSREVAAVLEVPLSHLLDPRNVREEARVQPDGSVAKAHSYAFQEHLIYGATARILTQFLSLVREARDKVAP